MPKIKKDDLTNATINLAVKNDDDFLSPYSPVGKPVISRDLAEFLDNAASAYLPKADIKLNIYSNCISENEKPVYTAAVRNYYSLQLTEASRGIARKTFISLIFAAIGILSLAVMFILSNFGLNEIWTECVDIFAWVFIWEAVDQYFIERKALLVKTRRIHAFANAEISFFDSSDDLTSSNFENLNPQKINP